MKEFIAGTNEAGQRLDKYLFKLMPEAGRAFLCRMMRKKNITLNDRKCEGNERVKAGDVVRIWFSDETFLKFSGSAVSEREKALSASLPEKDLLQPLILYEGDEVLLFSKPAGMLSQKAAPEDVSANEYLIRHLLGNGSLTESDLRTFRPAVVNRLDRNTSGILAAGKTLPALQSLSLLFKERGIEKYYLAGVAGAVTEKTELRGFLRKDAAVNRVSVSETRRGAEDREIRTSAEPLEVHEDRTLLRIHLITGRTHQIRAHLASIGHPVLGDPKYGFRELNEKLKKEAGLRAQLLHAYEIRFPEDERLPEEVRGRTFRDTAPEAFRTLFPASCGEKPETEGQF